MPSNLEKEIIMQFDQFIRTASFALSEGSIYERLRRNPAVEFDPYIFHATLIYDARYASILEQVHREYLDVGQRYQLPMFALTDTWRANQERISQSRFREHKVNQDNARFIARLRDSYGPTASPIFIGGQIGPRGDAYTPEEALPPAEAEQFHTPQLEAFAEARVDFLYAATLPALSEAQGIAKAMAKQGLPYILSFVIRRDGTLLDGTPLALAIETIDGTTPKSPTGYAVNCVHPAIFIDGLAALEKYSPALTQRILSFQANTSAKDPKELDALSELETEKPEILAELMLKAHRQFHTPFFGGCCGTDTSHIECLASAHKAILQ
jgi:homocysteine S-methyltransferase